MNRSPSLKTTIAKISVLAFVVTIAMTLAGALVYSRTKGVFARKSSIQELGRNAGHQIEQLIPSFLLPEQRDGAALLLERIKRSEGLNSVSIIHENESLSDDLLKCAPNKASPAFCESQDGEHIVGIFPIVESDQFFGYLVKASPNTLTWSSTQVFLLIGLFVLMMSLTFAMTYVFVARIFSKRIPKALDELVQWIEADLNDQRTDISNLPFKELEELRAKIAEVMDRHNKARDQAMIGQLTSGVMHDIRTPLQSVVTALHLVDREKIVGQKRSLRLENLAAMCRINLPVIGDIIETTLDGGRDVHVSKKNEDVSRTIQSAIGLCTNISSIRNAKVEFTGPEAIAIPHDSVQLGRVLHNLIKNGVEAGSTANTPKVSIELETVPNGVRISVEDNGPGLNCNPERLFRIFRSSKVRGTGLGLFISKKIVEAHGGSILASNASTLGGARFEVTLPRLDGISHVQGRACETTT